MAIKVLITVDTEADNMWNPALRQSPRFENIASLDKLQRVFDKFKAKPTYLVAYSVAKSEFVPVLKDIAKSSPCEIGAHLHALETPPFISQRQGDGSFLHQYAVEVQAQKLANIDRLLSDVFARKPVSYRGGRWSVNRDIIAILETKGYLVDSSVTPGISWQHIGGLNFKKSSRRDAFLNEWLLEVPATMMITSRFARLAMPLYLNLPDCTHIEGLLRRLSGFDIIWLDPSFNELEKMKQVCDRLIGDDVGFLNIIFHSSVIIAGGTPYTMTQASVELFFRRLNELLEYLMNGKKLESLTLEEYYNCRKKILN